MKKYPLKNIKKIQFKLKAQIILYKKMICKIMWIIKTKTLNLHKMVMNVEVMILLVLVNKTINLLIQRFQKKVKKSKNKNKKSFIVMMKYPMMKLIVSR